MAIKTDSELKRAFEPGKMPTAQDFEHLIDTFSVRIDELEGGYKGVMPNDVIPAPTGNVVYRVLISGDYNNLKHADGTSAPIINVADNEVSNDGIYDRIELRYDFFSNSWQKFSIEKRKVSAADVEPVISDRITGVVSYVGFGLEELNNFFDDLSNPPNANRWDFTEQHKVLKDGTITKIHANFQTISDTGTIRFAVVSKSLNGVAVRSFSDRITVIDGINLISVLLSCKEGDYLAITDASGVYIKYRNFASSPYVFHQRTVTNEENPTGATAEFSYSFEYTSTALLSDYVKAERFEFANPVAKDGFVQFPAVSDGFTELHYSSFSRAIVLNGSATVLNAFATFEVLTDADTLQLVAGSMLTGVNNGISIYVNDVLRQRVTGLTNPPTALPVVDISISAASNALKYVKVVTSTRQGDWDGCFIRQLIFQNGRYQQKISGAKKDNVCLFVTDSIGVGIGTTAPEQKGYIPLLRKEFANWDFISLGSGGFGFSSYVANPGTVQAMLRGIQTAIGGVKNAIIYIALGTNENGFSESDFKRHCNAMLDYIGFNFKGVKVFLQTLVKREGLNISQIQSWTTSCALGRSNVTVLLGDQIFSDTSLMPDGTHPGDAGNVQYKNWIKSKINFTI